MNEATMTGTDLGAIPLITAAVAILRGVWPSMPSRLLPLAAVIIGVAACLGMAGSFSVPLLIQGATNGLAASGLWNGAVKPGVNYARGKLAKPAKPAAGADKDK